MLSSEADCRVLPSGEKATPIDPSAMPLEPLLIYACCCIPEPDGASPEADTRVLPSGDKAGLLPENISTMSLGLSHSLSHYKLKFSPDKVDTMIVQAIALLDDLDKELNTYAMRVKEWYGWHFPEMGRIVNDNLAYARVILKMGMRTSASSADLANILPKLL